MQISAAVLKVIAPEVDIPVPAVEVLVKELEPGPAVVGDVEIALRGLNPGSGERFPVKIGGGRYTKYAWNREND